MPESVTFAHTCQVSHSDHVYQVPRDVFSKLSPTVCLQMTRCSMEAVPTWVPDCMVKRFLSLWKTTSDNRRGQSFILALVSGFSHSHLSLRLCFFACVVTQHIMVRTCSKRKTIHFVDNTHSKDGHTHTDTEVWYPSNDLASTRLHLLKVPLPSHSTTGWDTERPNCTNP